jgi:prolyl 4-hydroxylase
MFLKIIDNLLTKEECESLVKRVNESKLEFVDRGSAEYFRLQEDKPELANKLWLLVKDLLPEEYNGQKIMCLNTHFRYSKYESGMEFGIHRDGVNQDSNGYRSIMTLNIFLNDDFEGGSTDFFDNSGELILSAVPQVGSATLFDRRILHCGQRVTEGFKYLLRTDVMIC